MNGSTIRTNRRLRTRGTESHLLKDLVLTFQSASQALEKSYGDLQDRVRILTEDLERERGQRIRLERLAAMGEMAMELAHEIRNPLGSIELFASMLEGEYADQIVRSVRLLNHSVTNVLHFGKPIAPSPKQISVNSLLEGIRALIQPLAVQKKIRLEVECERQLLIKTTREAYPDIEEVIKQNHQYQTPEILALPVIAGSISYLEWLMAAVTARPRSE